MSNEIRERSEKRDASTEKITYTHSVEAKENNEKFILSSCMYISQYLYVCVWSTKKNVCCHITYHIYTTI